ncbi:23S rRNA (uracil-5-)-methyltransferase [Desulfonema limicola]|uniref:23S rRNA (Uracil-5-)-methyltransferase n=1 Tax=Desulfonema limicola TaxID=45656 RepID=A0A975GGM1_9BACT|nr:23S rRNA (uracil(1939)-C(5))-methyltransferase RlmD [Desulfonema limicola]QTA80367.1 23S rRNA (uracil-5-)-methyltransferase [Desulfonema limicola]
MKIKRSQEIELEITGMAFGGQGIAKVDGYTFFVDQAVPSDYISARITRKKKNFAQARIINLLKPSPLRIEPPCVYAGFCGGCKWQFLKYEDQLIYKQQHVLESLEHIGLIHGVKVHPAAGSEDIFGYRNKMEFSCSDKRWLLPDEMGSNDIDTGFALGLHVPGTFHKVLDISKCMLQPDQGNEILNSVRTYMINSGMPVYGLKTHEGFWRFLMLRHSKAFNQWMVNIITSSEDRKIIQPLADLLIEKYPNIVSIVNNITARKAGIAVGEYEILLAGTPILKDKIGSYEFEISANSFFQTNTKGAEKLYDIVEKYADLSGNEKVLDLYCGTGTIAICLSGKAKEITGIELAESSIADAQKNCQINKIDNCHFIQGDIKDCLGNINIVPDIVIIDPPRVGMHKDVVNQVLKISPEKIIYVSCNPATLARDLALIKDHYNIMEVQPVDMFPHTYHIESVARLEKK